MAGWSGNPLGASIETAELADDSVTYAKLQNVSATDRILGRSTAGAGDAEEITCTSTGRALIDDASTAAQRTTLGLVIGTDVLAYDAGVQSLAALATAADKFAYTTGVDTWAEAAITAAGRAVLDDVDATAQRVTLGVEIGVNVQAYDGELAAIAGLVSAADRLPYFTGAGTAALATFSAAGRAIVDDADATAQRVTLGLVIGADVQAYDAGLASLITVDTAADLLPYTTAASTWAATSLTAFARTFLDDVDGVSVRTTIGAAAVGATSPATVGNTNAGGASGEAARVDHVHAALATATTLADTPPASAALVTAGGTRWREVFGTIELTAAAAVDAVITIAIETGIGTGVYTDVIKARIAGGLTTTLGLPYTFKVATGRRYKFTKGAGVGVTETIGHYSFLDY